MLTTTYACKISWQTILFANQTFTNFVSYDYGIPTLRSHKKVVATYFLAKKPQQNKGMLSKDGLRLPMILFSFIERKLYSKPITKKNRRRKTL